MTRAALREGFTTGSAATAAAVAALRLLLDHEVLREVHIPTPPHAPLAEPHPSPDQLPDPYTPGLRIPVASVVRVADDAQASTPDATALMCGTARAVVIKDGGDDPDATHGAHIHVDLSIELYPDIENDQLPASAPNASPNTPPNASPPAGLSIEIDGGPGVGRVTLPGLPVPVGEAAINPGPRAQVRLALGRLCAERKLAGRIRVLVYVPDGEARARHTLNARLGILGGISILGTRGTVRPYSHDAWQQAIVQAIDVAAASGCTQLGLSTGRRSERLLEAQQPDWPATSFVQAADFIGFAVRAAAERGFCQLTWSCFCGKLVKLAAGQLHTHAHVVPLDLDFLADAADGVGIAATRVCAMRAANTASQAFELLLPDPQAPALVRLLLETAQQILLREAQDAARAAGRPAPAITVRLFHLDGHELGCVGG